jgi:hypothetical protein
MILLIKDLSYVYCKSTSVAVCRFSARVGRDVRAERAQLICFCKVPPG